MLTFMLCLASASLGACLGAAVMAIVATGTMPVPGPSNARRGPSGGVAS